MNAVRIIFLISIVLYVTLIVRLYADFRGTKHSRRGTIPPVTSHLTAAQPTELKQGEDDELTSGGYHGGSTVSEAPKADHNLAYVAIITNERYVDGAMVLGHSVRRHSALLSQGRCLLVLLVPKGRLRQNSIDRLLFSGFDEVRFFDPLAPNSKALLKDTFDKLHMFNLTEFSTIVFLDSDMLALRPMDELFHTNLRHGAAVGAIGSNPHGRHRPYFQTGMMVLQPSATAFAKMLHLLRTDPQFNRYAARDGVLLRLHFGNNYVPISSKYSRHLHPEEQTLPGGIVALHYRGMFKPWDDRTKPVLRPKYGGKEFGIAYALWWSEYEALHAEGINATSSWVPLGEPFGGTASGSGVTPRTHVWMLRYTKDTYVQETRKAKQGRFDRFASNDTGTVVVTTAEESCAEACESIGAQCSETVMRSSAVNSCNTLSRHFSCLNSCSDAVATAARELSVFPGVVDGACFTNPLWVDEQPFSYPSCNGHAKGVRRLCGCLHAAPSP